MSLTQVGAAQKCTYNSLLPSSSNDKLVLQLINWMVVVVIVGNWTGYLPSYYVVGTSQHNVCISCYLQMKVIDVANT